MKGGVGAFAGLGAILAGVPAVMIWHEMAGPYELPGNTWIVRIANLARKQIVQRACVHVGLTKACLESKSLPERIMQFVIPTPVDEELFATTGALNEQKRDVDVLFVGRLIEEKGILVLAEALRKLSVDGRLLRARIVGDGGDRERMEAALRDIGTLSVTFTGSQTGSALAHSYASSRILVVPSTTHPEGQAIVVAEGMAFGLPVVVSDQAVLKEVIGDAGVIVRNGDAEGLASALRTLLRDQDQWKQLSDRARQRSQLFSMSNFRQGIADLIGEVATHCQS
jgi:glycosyltransferase involved in cell wall biosynthesis